MHKYKILPFILLVFFFEKNIHAQNNTPDKHEFSIKQCIDYANKNNLQVKNALLSFQNQQQVNREYTAAALPTVSGSIGYTYYMNTPKYAMSDFLSPAIYGILYQNNVQNSATGQVVNPPNDYGSFDFSFYQKNNTSLGVQLQQVLFDGQVFVALQSRKALLDFEKKNIDVTQEMIKANIYKVYYQLVISKTQTQILDANIERLQKLQHDEEIMYKNGFAEKLDLDKVAVQLANLQTQKEKVLNTIQIGYLGLKTLLGMPVKDELILTDKITEDEIKNGLLDTGYQYSDRKEFQYLNVGRKLNELNIKRYKLSYLPSIGIGAAYSKVAMSNDFSFSKGNWLTTSYLGLNISVPIFDGFFKDSKIKEAKITMQQTDAQIDDLKRSIDNEVAQARLNYKSAVITLDNQKQNMQLAESVYDQTKKKYEAGVGSNLEINTAQTDLITAQTNYISAMYDAVIAKIDFNKAIGKLN